MHKPEKLFLIWRTSGVIGNLGVAGLDTDMFQLGHGLLL